MIILQKMFAAFLSVITFFSLSRPFSSGFDEAKFVAALNARDVAALESMMSQRMKDAYPDLTEQLGEFFGFMDEATDEAFIKGTFDPWDGIISDFFERISDRIGYEYIKGNYKGPGDSGMTSSGSEVWWYHFNFGNIRPKNPGEFALYGDYRLLVDWARIAGGGRGITRLRLIKDWVHSGDPENMETLFDIEVDWD